MDYKMRRSDRKIEQSETEEILKCNQYGVLSTVGADGEPYGVPLSYVYENNCLYFHCAQEGHKLENIKFNSRVSFCVVGRTEVLPEKFSTRYESVIIKGRIHELNGEDKSHILFELVEKYSPNFREKGKAYIESSKTEVCVFCMEIVQISGKSRR